VLTNEGETPLTNILVLMTTSDRRETQKIVKKLMELHLIACVNIGGPVESHWWHVEIERADEFLALMKSNQKLFNKLTKTIRKLHSYEVPEILSVPIVKGYKP
jgi:periplasmic divalent cation tolerance protein